MKISILIPTHNRRVMVGEAIRKIFSLEPRAFHEVIVSDNHSTDGTEKALFEEFGNKIVFTQPKTPVTAYQNWRHSYDQASGTHVHFHWSDDWLGGNFYAHARLRQEQTGSNFFMTSARVVHEDGFNPVFYSQGGSRRLAPPKALRRLFLEEGGELPRSPMAYLFPRDGLRESWWDSIPSVNGHDPLKLAIGPDALLIAGALLKEKTGLEILPGPDVCFRHHAGSISVQNERLLGLYQHCYLFFARQHRLRELELALLAGGSKPPPRDSWFCRLRKSLFRPGGASVS